VPVDIKKSHIIFLIDPKNVVLSGGIDTLNRHQIYAERIENIETNLQLCEFKILCNYDEKIEKLQEKYKFLLSTPRKNIAKNINFLRASLKIIKKRRGDSNLLVAGDPWQAAIYCLILKFLIKKNTRIQVQVHADIGEKLWRRESFKNHIKYYISLYTLKRADSIRCVSEPQLKKIEKNLKVNRTIMFVSGTLFNISKKSKIKNNNATVPTIGFIGRLEPDRGIWEFINIVQKLNDFGVNTDIKIAGSGKFQLQFIGTLKTINSGKVDYIGHLSIEEMSFFWNTIDLSIFTAPTESFGRGMRESLVNKVPVWAMNSSGLEDLESKFSSDEITKIEKLESKESLGEKFYRSINLKIDYDYASYFIKEQKMDLDRLIQSWVCQ